MPLIKRKIFTEGYACKESLLKVIFILLLAHRNAYKEILNFYKVKTLVPVWFKFFKPKIRNFFLGLK